MEMTNKLSFNRIKSSMRISYRQFKIEELKELKLYIFQKETKGEIFSRKYVPRGT